MVPIILLIGLPGNLIAFVILSPRKKLKIDLINMYKYLFISDTFYLLFMIFDYLQYGFDIDLTFSSKYSCKPIWYFDYCLSTISPMILVYISVEKVISIKCQSKNLMLTQELALK